MVLRVSPRWFPLVLFLGHCGYTTTVAAEPVAALDKWNWVWKALVFAAFLPLTLRTKLRMEATILTMVLCASALIVTGGIKTAAGGGGYGSLVILIDDNSGLFEGSIVSCVAITIIPLILWLAKHGTIFRPDWKVRVYAACLIFACLLIPVGTQARTGIVCIAVLGILLLRYVRHRMLYLGAGALVGATIRLKFWRERADAIPGGREERLMPQQDIEIILARQLASYLALPVFISARGLSKERDARSGIANPKYRLLARAGKAARLRLTAGGRCSNAPTHI